MKSWLIFIVFWGAAIIAAGQKPVTGKNLMDKLSTKAEFPGGDMALLKYLSKNIQYPATEADNYVQGKVIVRFMINEIGGISDVELLREVSPGIDKEVVREVKLMPKWKPATYNNKPVAVYYLLPVQFRIN